jgi:hypothetical protein
MAQSDKNPRSMVNTLLIVMIGQVGCITLAVIILFVLGGLWLDNLFGTRPFITLALLVAGVPLSVILMLYVARRTLARLKAESETNN